MQNIIVHPATKEEMTIIQAFFQALKIKFEVTTTSPYNAEFVEKVLQGKKDIEQNKGVTISIEELNDLCK